MTATKPYDVWLWVELIGFDNEQPDYGVEAYLRNAGLAPDAVALLLFNPDFVHSHEGLAEHRPLPFDCCSYGGHPYGYDRARQDWTTHQLRGLVATLRQRGIAVYLSLFDMFVSDPWLGQHPEVWHVTSAGERIRSVCPWKHLADGSWYEDFFAAQLARVLTDYSFDGFHQADGYSHPRLPLHVGDSSDDMIAQFLGDASVSLPAPLAEPSGDDPGVIGERAAWIWGHARREWIGFYARRVTRFCRTVAEAVHGVGGQVVLNQALTREPLEALYRYGVDYRAIAEVGVDGFVCETVAPGVALGAESGMEANPHYDYQAALLMMKARLPGVTLRCLNGVHDVNEQWDVLRHGPASLEREIQCQSNLFRWTAGGDLERCSAGPVVCLADGLQPHEWQWLREWWDLAFATNSRRTRGATLIWSDNTFEPQLGEYIATRRWTTHKLLQELMARGAPVHAVARIEDLAAVQGPLLALNPQLLPEDELQALLAYNRGPLALIGGLPAGLPAADVAFRDVHEPGALRCAVYGAAQGYQASIAPEGLEALPEDLMGLPEPPTFVQELPFRKVSEGFLRACAELLASCAGVVRVLRRADVIRVQTLELEEGLLRLLIGNDSHYYVITELDLGETVRTARVVSSFPGTPPAVAGSTLTVRVPGKGIVVLEVAVE